MVGGSRAWLILGGAVWGVRLLRQMASTRQMRKVLSQELRPGESLIISHLSDESQ